MDHEIERLKEKLIPVLRKNKIRKAGIFGSYARGEQKKESDVDILVELAEEVSLFGFIDLKQALEKAIRRKVDLVEYECIRKEIRDQVLKDEIPLFG